MVFNHQFWMGVVHREFEPQLRMIVETLEKRMLPAFAGIDDDADAVAEEAWDAFMSAADPEHSDPGDFAEAAQDAGISHYMLLNGIRQGMVNLFASALHHTFEQQIMMFLRRAVLDRREENDRSLFQMSEFQKRMRAVGIEITTFSSWAKVEELRLVANTVKHAEGDSAHKLHQMRPDLFISPATPELNRVFWEPHVFLPLAGQDLWAIGGVTVCLQLTVVVSDTLTNKPVESASVTLMGSFSMRVGWNQSSPALASTRQRDVTASVQFTWWPSLEAKRPYRWSPR